MTAPTTDAPPRRWTGGRVLVIVVVVAMVAMWGYVLYLAFGPGRQPPPDRLADPALRAARPKAVCEGALAEVATLPPAVEAADGRASEPRSWPRPTIASPPWSTTSSRWPPTARTGRSWRSGSPTGAPTSATGSAYADALRTDPEARLYVTAKDREQVTEYIDAFAADNHMPACGTPIDV